MVVKEYLENQGVDLKQFQQLQRSQPLPRQRLNQMVEEDITIPVPRTNKEIKETLKVKLVSLKANKLDTCRSLKS